MLMFEFLPLNVKVSNLKWDYEILSVAACFFFFPRIVTGQAHSPLSYLENITIS